MKRRIALEASKTLAVYGFAGWVYIALAALVHPRTLGLQLTHFTSFPHEDTFGEGCFVVSLLSFFCYNLLRAAQPEQAASAGQPGAGRGMVPAEPAGGQHSQAE
jgi:cytosine/uracil/thiamine/allantoin permease